MSSAMQRIAKASGGAVMGIAHHGKDNSKGVAGSFAQKANVDFILKALVNVDDALSGEVKARHLAFDKLRDGRTGWQSEYRLLPVKLGENADGKEVFSAFVESVEGGGVRLAAVKKDKVGRPNASEQIGLRALREAIAECGEQVPASNHIPKNVRIVSTECWRDYAYRLGISNGGARAQQTAFKRAQDGLLAKQLIGVWNDQVWVARRGCAVVVDLCRSKIRVRSIFAAHGDRSLRPSPPSFAVIARKVFRVAGMENFANTLVLSRRWVRSCAK
jgi:hypothetical protein